MRSAQVGGEVPPQRRDQQRRVARRTRDRELLPKPQRRGRGVQPDGAAVHRPGRARADPPRSGAGARRWPAQPSRVRRARTGRRPASPRSCAISTAAPRRRCARDYVVAADGNRSPTRERLGIAMRGHGVLSNSVTIYFRVRSRPRAAARGPRPGRQLRHQSRAARVLPARPDGQPGVPGRQPRRRHRAPRDRCRISVGAVGERRADDRRAARAGTRCAPRSAFPRSRS